MNQPRAIYLLLLALVVAAVLGLLLYRFTTTHDRVAVRWHWTGTHLGTFRGVAPTERAVTNSGAAIFRLEGGRVVAAMLETDRLGFLQAIGVVPPDRELFP